MKQLLVTESPAIEVYSDHERGMLLCPLITTSETMWSETYLSRKYKLECSKIVITFQQVNIASTSLQYCVASDEGESCAVVRKQIALLHDLLCFRAFGVFGAQGGGYGRTIGRSVIQRWFQPLVSATMDLYRSHQSMLVQGIESVDLNVDNRAQLVAALEKGTQECDNVIHAVLLVGTKCAAVYSRPQSWVLAPRDILCMIIYAESVYKITARSNEPINMDFPSSNTVETTTTQAAAAAAASEPVTPSKEGLTDMSNDPIIERDVATGSLLTATANSDEDLETATEPTDTDAANEDLENNDTVPKQQRTANNETATTGSSSTSATAEANSETPKSMLENAYFHVGVNARRQFQLYSEKLEQNSTLLLVCQPPPKPVVTSPQRPGMRAGRSNPSSPMAVGSVPAGSHMRSGHMRTASYTVSQTYVASSTESLMTSSASSASQPQMLQRSQSTISESNKTDTNGDDATEQPAGADTSQPPAPASAEVPTNDTASDSAPVMSPRSPSSSLGELLQNEQQQQQQQKVTNQLHQQLFNKSKPGNDFKRTASAPTTAVMTPEREELSRAAANVNSELKAYASFLNVREKYHITMFPYTQKCPGLIHFIFVDRVRDRVVAPKIVSLHSTMPTKSDTPTGDQPLLFSAGEPATAATNEPTVSEQFIKQKIWEMCNMVQEHIERGYTEVCISTKQVQYSYKAWAEEDDKDGRRTEIPYSKINMNNFHRYKHLELYTIHLPFISAPAVVANNRKLVEQLRDFIV